MATNEIQGSAIPLEISTDGSTYKTLVCLKTYGLDITSDVSEENTDCGKITSVGIPGAKFSADAVCNSAPAAGLEVTYRECKTWILASTLLYFRFRYPGSGGSAGANVSVTFQGYLTKVTLSKDTTKTIQFTVDAQSTGTIS